MSRRWIVFVLACAVSWLLYVHRYAWGVIKPELQAEYPELTDVELGWLDSLFQITYALGQVPSGMAADVLGPRLVLTALLVLWSGSLTALAWGQGFLSFGGVRAAFGLAQAGCYPALSKVTKNWFAPAIRTTVQGFVASLSGRAGGACASLLVATLLMHSLGLDWRQSLVAIASLGFILAAAFWLLFRDHPEQAVEPEPALPAAGPPSPQRLTWTTRGIITLLALCLYSACSTFADMLYVYWIPLYLRQAKGLSMAEMGVFAGLPLWGGALGGLVGGVLNDLLIRWTGSVRLSRAAVAIAGKSIGGALIVASLFVNDGRYVMLVLLGVKFFGDWSLSTQWGAITDVAGSSAGTIFGIVNTCGALAGFAAGPIMGYVKREYGWDALFILVASIYGAAAACWLLIDSSRRLSAK